MAKFKLKEALIPKLAARNVISPVTGKITLRLPCKTKRITGERCFELSFSPYAVIETNNEFTALVLAGKTSPKIWFGSDWFIADPSIPWFDRVPDEVPASIGVEQNGIEVLTSKQRKLINEYASEKGIELPKLLPVNSSNQALLNLASLHRDANVFSKKQDG
jgi:hypothetical protein